MQMTSSNNPQTQICATEQSLKNGIKIKKGFSMTFVQFEG